MNDDSTNQWSILESVTEYETPWYTGGYDRLSQPDGSDKKYYWADLPDATVVVARRGHEIVFVDQYRPVIQEQCLELPAGLVEPGESYEQAGRRELLEETGMQAERVQLMQELSCTTGLLRHKRGMVWAEGLTETDRELDENEFITVETIHVDDVLETVRSQPANDATLEGILLARADGHI